MKWKRTRAYGRAWYKKHAIRIRAEEKIERQQARKWLWSFKRHPCRQCEKKYHPAAMQFDHVRGVKKFMVNVAAVGHYSKERVLTEMKKCDLVCANCHHVRTWKRRWTPKFYPNRKGK